MMKPMERKIKNISMMKQDKYYDNLRLSGIRDTVYDPKDGSDYISRNKTDGIKTDLGSFHKIDFNEFVKDREIIRKAIGNDLTLTEAKLPKPVVVTDYDAVQQQPAVNVANVNIPMLGDLNDIQQLSVLGDKELNKYIKKNPIEQKLKNIQMNIYAPLYKPNTKDKILRMTK